MLVVVGSHGHFWEALDGLRVGPWLDSSPAGSEQTVHHAHVRQLVLIEVLHIVPKKKPIYTSCLGHSDCSLLGFSCVGF